MEIAKCPDCGSEVTEEDITSEQVRLALVAGMLIGAASVIGVLMELPEYALTGVRDGYSDRLREVTEQITEHVGAFVDWGEAYDG